MRVSICTVIYLLLVVIAPQSTAGDGPDGNALKEEELRLANEQIDGLKSQVDKSNTALENITKELESSRSEHAAKQQELNERIQELRNFGKVEALSDKQITAEKEALHEQVETLNREKAELQTNVKQKTEDLEASSRQYKDMLEQKERSEKARKELLEKASTEKAELETAFKNEVEQLRNKTLKLEDQSQQETKKVKTLLEQSMKNQAFDLEKISSLEEVIRRSKERNDAFRSEKQKLEQVAKQLKKDLVDAKDAQFKLRRENHKAKETIREMERGTLEYKVKEKWEHFTSIPEIKSLREKMTSVWNALLDGTISLPTDNPIDHVVYRIRRFSGLVYEESCEFLEPLQEVEPIKQVLKFRSTLSMSAEQKIAKWSSIARRFCILQEGPRASSLMHTLSAFVEDNCQKIVGWVETIIYLLLVRFLMTRLGRRKEVTEVTGEEDETGRVPY